jgi:cyclase
MRRLSKNVYTEIYFWGCNPSFLVTDDGVVMFDTPQQPIDAVRWREAMLAHGPIRYLINTEPHQDHIRGNAYFPGVEVIGQELLRPRYDDYFATLDWQAMRQQMEQADPDSVWLFQHADYPLNPPTRLFGKELTLHLGNHTLQITHMPGHTKPQTSIFIPEENVLITGDNIFSGCKTFVQEADPWEWLESLERIRAVDAEVIVPGHGEPVDNSYLATQAQVLHNWIGMVEDFVRRGLSEEEAMQQPIDASKLDPYPIGQRLYPRDAWLNGANVSNLYRKIKARQASGAPA